MGRSYAVAWQNGDGQQHAGRLDLGPAALRLEGASATDELRYADLSEVRIARQPEERLSGRATLVVRGRTGRTMRIACIGEPGALPELVEQLTRQIPS